jgi:2-amino-4-hydroxy-6-hydroxymethyldihydropteridine diphosphokinase
MAEHAPRAARRWLPAYVGIGSNLDDPEMQVVRAFGLLQALTGAKLVARSALFRSRPLGSIEQPHFVNAVAALVTQSTPEKLLDQLRDIERQMGRAVPRERWGPRRIDLDLLAVGSEVRRSDALALPHPGIAERDFVLYPLAEVAPDLFIPSLGRVADLKARVAVRGIERLGG